MAGRYDRKVPPPSQTGAYTALFLVALLWGSFPATAKLALRDMSPFAMATLRCAVASLFLMGLVVRGGAETTRGAVWASVRSLLVLGFLGVVCAIQVSYLGIATTTAANAAVLQAASPVMVALGARAALGERLGPVQWLGILISAAGVLLVVTDGRLAGLRVHDLRLGDFLTLLGLATWSAYTIYGKRVLVSVSPDVATAGAYVCGTVLLIPLAAVTAPFFPAPRLVSPVAWAVILFHALTGALAHVWWYRAVARVGATRAAIFQNVTPVVGVALAAALLGEAPGPWTIVGGGLVLAGVALTTRGQGRRGRS